MSPQILDVWTEVTVSSNGVGITLYSETRSGRVLAEDETYFTFDEIQERSPGEPLSLNLSDGSREELRTVDNSAI